MLSLSLTEHPGDLTESDIRENLRKAIKRSNEYGEDWIADIEMDWYQRSGVIEPTDEDLLDDEDEIEKTSKRVLEAEARRILRKELEFAYQTQGYETNYDIEVWNINEWYLTKF